MRIIRSIPGLRKIIVLNKKKGCSIGFVPTMGALHAGHGSLIRQSRRENDLTVLSIFVNPAQFGPKEDFSRYPRPFAKDKSFAFKEKVDIIFYPSVDGIYPEGFRTDVEVKDLGNKLCGRSRPGHFKGVATVVAKLLNIVAPDRVYLGQKDGQQVVVLKQMAKDLNFPVRIKVCPTVREKDGLAMSSRNQYLTPQQRREAPVLFQSLTKAKELVHRGERSSSKVLKLIRGNITRHSSGDVDYAACVNADTLEALNSIRGKIMIALAVHFGKTRLIDNIVLSVK